MKLLYILCFLCTQQAFAQQGNKADEKVIRHLKKSIDYLADDKLEGRRTGSKGEALAYKYISKEFKKAGLAPAGTDGYIQPFPVNDGKSIVNSFIKWDDKPLRLNEDFFPMAYSGSADLKVNNQDAVGYIDLGLALTSNTGNPHFDLNQWITDTLKAIALTQKQLVILYNNSSIKDELAFDEKYKQAAVGIPVIYIKQPFSAGLPTKFFKEITGHLQIDPQGRTGHNVIGFVDNHAASTVIIGAHYDHLGYGEDHNSLYIGNTKMIHNGADDNASGTAALIELAGWLKKSGLTKHNYLLAAFSGEELGLYGSKYLTDHSPVDLTRVNYMINMDMVGRMNDSTHGLTIGGYGTSPRWATLIPPSSPMLKIKIDSSGTGPSDHTSFYRKDIPVLFFFTGTHSDYHKPSDDADKINYAGEMEVINLVKHILTQTNTEEKIAFTKTRETSTGKSSFKVSLGIMPDYTYSGAGVLVDGISEGKAAQKAGIKTGDVLIQLGEHKFTDVMSYMNALNQFNKGEATTVKLRRGKEEIILPVIF